MHALLAARIGVATRLLCAPGSGRPAGALAGWGFGRLARGCAECLSELAPAPDIELPVDAGEVFLDRLHGDKQLLGDLAIGAAAGGAAGDPQLARGQCPDPADTGTPRPPASGDEVLAGPLGHRDRSAAVSGVRRPSQRAEAN